MHRSYPSVWIDLTAVLVGVVHVQCNVSRFLDYRSVIREEQWDLLPPVNRLLMMWPNNTYGQLQCRYHTRAIVYTNTHTHTRTNNKVNQFTGEYFKNSTGSVINSEHRGMQHAWMDEGWWIA